MNEFRVVFGTSNSFYCSRQQDRIRKLLMYLAAVSNNFSECLVSSWLWWRGCSPRNRLVTDSYEGTADLIEISYKWTAARSSSPECCEDIKRWVVCSWLGAQGATDVLFLAKVPLLDPFIEVRPLWRCRLVWFDCPEEFSVTLKKKVGDQVKLNTQLITFEINTTNRCRSEFRISKHMKNGCLTELQCWTWIKFRTGICIKTEVNFETRVVLQNSIPWIVENNQYTVF